MGQIVGGRALQEIAPDAGCQKSVDIGRIFVDCQRQEPDIRATLPELLGQLEAVHVGHGDVDDGDVGLQPADDLESGCACPGLADDFEVGSALEQRFHACQDDRMVVDEDDTYGAHGCALSLGIGT